MQKISEAIQNLNWQEITESLNQKGYAKISSLITDNQCNSLKSLYSQPTYFRKQL